MITVKRLKEMLAQLPSDWDNARCQAYEGEEIGITIIHSIRASPCVFNDLSNRKTGNHD
jgi:hypothetical protein